MNLRKLYAALIALYPYDYKVRFSAEMRAAFSESLDERRSQGLPALVVFAANEIATLVPGAAREWIDKLTASASLRGRILPDLRKMRPADVARQVWFAGRATADSADHVSDLQQAERRTRFCLQQMVDAIDCREFEIARAYSYQERAEREHLTLLLKQNAAG